MAKRGKGQPKKIESPEKLWEYFQSYVEYKKGNPKYENKANMKTGEIIPVPKELPLTWVGFEVWLFENGIINHLENYRYNTGGDYSEYLGIIKTIDQIIYEDKFTGASAGIFQHNIIARDLGLIDKKEVKSDVKATMVDLTDDELREQIERLRDFPNE